MLLINACYNNIARKDNKSHPDSHKQPVPADEDIYPHDSCAVSLSNLAVYPAEEICMYIHIILYIIHYS